MRTRVAGRLIVKGKIIIIITKIPGRLKDYNLIVSGTGLIFQVSV